MQISTRGIDGTIPYLILPVFEGEMYLLRNVHIAQWTLNAMPQIIDVSSYGNGAAKRILEPGPISGEISYMCSEVSIINDDRLIIPTLKTYSVSDLLRVVKEKLQDRRK